MSCCVLESKMLVNPKRKKKVKEDLVLAAERIKLVRSALAFV